MTESKRGKPGRLKDSTYEIADEIEAGWGSRINRAMHHRGIETNAELARLVGCSRALIGEYIKGNRKRPSPKLLMLIAKFLRVNPFWLVLNDRPMLEGIQEVPPPEFPGAVSAAKRIRGDTRPRA